MHIHALNLTCSDSCCCMPSGTPDIIDPTQKQTLTVTLKSEYAAVMGNLSAAAMEHTKGTPVSVVANAFTIEVPSGEVRIVAVDHISHSDHAVGKS